MVERVAGFVVESFPISGFEFRESHAGTHRFVEARRDRGEMPFSFEVYAHTDQLRELLHPETREFFRMTIEGAVRMEGLAASVPLSGTLELSIIRKRQIVHDFRFTADSGVLHRFYGHKDLSMFQPLKSWTTLYGEVSVVKTGRVISTSVSYFDMRDLPRLLASIKVR